MRDRLIKLLQDNSYLDVLDGEHWLLAAEQLLANGVVVIDTDVVSPENRPLISQYMGRPIDEVINLIRRSEWISVDERLPEKSGCYLTFSAGGRRAPLDFSSVHKLFNAFDSSTPELAELFSIRVTHWMPLPEPPMMKGGAE